MLNEKDLNPGQIKALDRLCDWWASAKYGNGRMTHILGGFAGTGKSTIAETFIRRIRDNQTVNIACVALMGRAAMILRSKVNHLLTPHDFCGTVHSFIYRPIISSDQSIDQEDVEAFINEMIDDEPTRPGTTEQLILLPTDKAKSDEDRNVNYVPRPMMDLINYDLFIVDEASTISSQIHQDLLRYNKPVLFMGDHGQLPPVGDSFNIMKNPDTRLTEIMRQEEGHPIVRLSMIARMEGDIPFGEFGSGVRKVGGAAALSRINWKDYDILLCGFNKTRVAMNKSLRASHGYNEPFPMVGEPVICLRNNRKRGIYNGMMGNVRWCNLRNLKPPREPAKRTFFDMGITFPFRKPDTYSGLADPYFFGNPEAAGAENYGFIDIFDYGYAITVHKSQGGEYDSVVLVEEKSRQMSPDIWSRWLYTGITRAVNKLLIIGR